MKRILFQGDSITDAGRDRNMDFYNLGHGYASMTASQLGCEFPGRFEFINRGLNGNKITDLYARMKSDIINLSPDVLTILIGVNDVWKEINSKSGTDTDKFEKIYCMLIEEIKEKLPHTIILVLEPFLVKGTETEKHWKEFRKGVEDKAMVSKIVADKYKLDFVPLMGKFDEAVKNVNEEYFVFDGVHPMPAGHGIIKSELSKKLCELIAEVRI